MLKGIGRKFAIELLSSAFIKGAVCVRLYIAFVYTFYMREKYLSY